MAAAGDYDDILELLFENGAEMDARDLVVSWCSPYYAIDLQIHLGRFSRTEGM